jgi:peptidoglycan-associated lipoprotein
MRAFTRALAILLPVAMLWGCSTTPTETTAGGAGTGAAVSQPAETGGAAGGGAMAPGVEVGGVEQGGGFTGSPLDDPNSLLSKRTVYFDFDKSEIKPEARKIIEAHAEYLSSHPSTHIVLEGHADERGTREYNLGLGERRAKAVEQVMTLLGVSRSQIEVVSYGEERPAAMGHDESAWSLNRRVEIVY